MRPDEVAAGEGAESDPLRHVYKMCRRLEDTRDHLREDVAKVDDPLFQAMFDQASLVLDQLLSAFHAYAAERSARRLQ